MTKKTAIQTEAMLAKRKLILKEAFKKAKVAKISGYPDNAIKRGDVSGSSDWHSRESFYREAREMGYYADHDYRGGGGGDAQRTLKEYGF